MSKDYCIIVCFSFYGRYYLHLSHTFLSKKDVAKMIGGDGACCKPIGVCCMSNDILVWGLFSQLTTHHTKNIEYVSRRALDKSVRRISKRSTQCAPDTSKWLPKCFVKCCFLSHCNVLNSTQLGQVRHLWRNGQ